MKKMQWQVITKCCICILVPEGEMFLDRLIVMTSCKIIWRWEYMLASLTVAAHLQVCKCNIDMHRSMCWKWNLAVTFIMCWRHSHMWLEVTYLDRSSKTSYLPFLWLMSKPSSIVGAVCGSLLISTPMSMIMFSTALWSTDDISKSSLHKNLDMVESWIFAWYFMSPSHSNLFNMLTLLTW